MKSAEIQAFTDEQLVHKELQLERDLIELRFRHRDANNQLDDTSKLRKIRKDIARLRTAQRSRERSAELPKDALRNSHRGTFKAGAAIVGGGTAGGAFLQGFAAKAGIGEQAGSDLDAG
jgi:large subunit ribosomal protein L29